MHSRYQDLLAQYASKHKDLANTMINPVLADARFMEKFVVVGGKTKPNASDGTPCFTTATSVVITNKDDKEHRSPWEWFATFDKPYVLAR